MPKTVEDYLNEATSGFEAGFQSKAGQKRALEAVSSAYARIRRNLMDTFLDERGTVAVDDDNRFVMTAEQQRLHDLYWSVPDLHNVREKHFEIFAAYPVFEQVRDMIALREAIKGAAIVAKPVDVAAERVETIRKSIIEQIEMRKAQFVRGMNVARLFNGLPVSVNAHLVHGHKGTVFLRHFFYLAGELTPLNIIMGVADAHAREKEGK
jgi:hypothetical protein